MKNEYTLYKHIALNGLNTLTHIINKAKESGIAETQLVNAKLAGDMFDFKRQVQIFTDSCKGAVARFAQTENPKYEDVETTFDELLARVAKTKMFIESVGDDKFAGAENIKIKLPWMPEGKYFKGSDYAQNFVIQNALFHLVTAYDILRNQGVNLGKADYIGNIEMQTE